MSAKQPDGPGIHASLSRRENLAYNFQEVLTAVVRLKNGRQPEGGERVFRDQMKSLLLSATEGAAKAGYSTTIIERAVFAAVAFTDESALKNHSFSEWLSKPLQQELFKGHTGGELFFEDVQRLLSRQDSTEVADLLEVYQLCILLGFRGKYGMGSLDGLRFQIKAISEKIQRNRGPLGDLSPAWKPPTEEFRPPQKDPWERRLLFAFGIGAVLAFVLFIVFSVNLKSELANLSPAKTERR